MVGILRFFSAQFYCAWVRNRISNNTTARVTDAVIIPAIESLKLPKIFTITIALSLLQILFRETWLGVRLLISQLGPILANSALHSVLETSMSLWKPPLPRLLLKNVSCMRNAQQILRHVNISIHDGGALVLTGSNGSGKSTFLRMLAGFSKPSAGEILWNGHDITQSGIFHQYKLQLNWLSLKDAVKEKFTVLDNVQWFEVLEGKQGNSLPALELMGLGRLAKEKARMLSMGQRKRLQLARLLAIDRPIWLLDEPSVALDDDGVRLLEYIIADHRKNGGIVIVATHLPIQIEDAMNLRLPPRFPRRMTLVDMLDRADIS